MATALQQQLQAIQQNSTNQLDLKAQRQQHSKSLLFAPNVAANQTFDTIYQICIEGFQDLCSLDPRYVPFAQNLFSEQSKTEDRGQMTAAENKELDAVIDTFLPLVSGRLLLRPAMKAVEWLVRRFRVHEFNTASLILAFLPYHTNPVFPTMLSILPKTLPPAFKFLGPYVASLSTPPRHAVLYAAINNTDFFSLFNRTMIATAANAHHSATALGFWASITAQAINAQLDNAQSGRPDVRSQRQEDLLLRVVPLLHETLRIKNVPELFLSSCMIITILVTKAQLHDKLLDALMEAVVRASSPTTLDDALTCVSIVAEERQSIELPRSTARALLKTPHLVESLSQLSKTVHLARLFMGIATAAVDELAAPSASDALDVVESALNTDALAQTQKAVVLAALLRATTEASDKPIPQPALERVKNLLSHLSQSPATSALVAQAAAHAQIHLANLELQLGLSLAPAEALTQSADMDVDMDEDEQPTEDSTAMVQQAFDALPSSLGQCRSFLAAQPIPAFEAFAHAYLALLQANRQPKELLDHPMLNSTELLESPEQLTFLARLWCGNSPVKARASALTVAATKLREVSGKPADLQGLIPYALVALSDPSQAVRRAAADLFMAISALYHATGDKGKVSDAMPVWASKHVYEEDSNSLVTLTSSEAYKILSVALLPSLEECIMDQAHISRVVSNALNGTQEQTNQTSNAAQDLKSSVRISLFNFLCSHTVLTGLMTVRLQLLTFLSLAGKSGSTGRTQILIPALHKWISSSAESRNALCQSFNVDRQSIDKAYISCLAARTSEELMCLRGLAKGEIGNEAEVSTHALHHLKHLWSSMKSGAKVATASFLLDIVLDEDSSELASTRQSEAIEVLRQVTLPTEALSTLLASVPDIAKMEEKAPPSKRRRTSRSESAKAQNIDVSELHAAIRRLTVVLELIEGSRPERHPELLKNLFHILSELQHYRTQLSSNLVYLQQLVIGSLLSIVDSLKQNPSVQVDRSVLRADLIVECVRTSSNAQIHNSALLLISSLASWAPDLVLHSVMPIFTFMSNTLLRQSDDYSAHVIDQTVSRVVPPLVSSLRKKNQDLITGAAELLLSFTAAFEHIPMHRRLRLFSHLVNALGPQDSLPAIIAMLFEKYPTDRRVPTFASELMSSFAPLVQLQAALRYLDLVEDALKPKRSVSEAIFVFNDKSAQQIEQSITHLLQSLAKLLQSRPLHVQISKGLDKDQGIAAPLQTASAALLERTMTLSTSLANRPSLQLATGNVLAASLGLLPTSHYIISAQALLAKPDEELRLMVVQSLEARARDAKSSDSATAGALLDILSEVTAIVHSDSSARLKHNAVTCIDVVCEKFGKKDPAKVFTAAQTVCSDSAFGSADEELRIISLLCLATMVETLKDDLVPLLPQTLSRAFEYLDQACDDPADGQRVHDAVYALLCAILENLPWIFSAQTLDRALTLTQRSAGSSTLGRRAANNREHFSVLVARQIPAAEVFPALDRTFDGSFKSGYLACSETLRVFHKVITNQTKSVLIKNAPTLFLILNKAFDLRRLLAIEGTAATTEEIAALDDQRDALTLDAIMRLNDATFRPFFVRLVEWTTNDLPKKDESGRTLRLISVYGFLAKFFDSLKSIVTSYSSYVLEQAATIVQSAKPTGENQIALLQKVLDTLSCSFKNDQDDFWQAPSHFDAIWQPLLHQLGHANTPDVRETIQIIPAITNLASAAASPEHHKALNSAILKMMRDDDAAVRLAAVQCEEDLTAKLGEDWLGLLPEMLPFISELQEDDDEDVEREALRWIRQIEGVLGESLEGMLQ